MKDSIFYKLGAVFCFAIAIFLAMQINPGFQIAGYIIVISHIIVFVLLGILGIVGARFGLLPYSIAGCAFWIAGIIITLTGIFSAGGGTNLLIIGGLSLIYGMIFAAIGSQILDRENELRIEELRRKGMKCHDCEHFAKIEDIPVSHTICALDRRRVERSHDACLKFKKKAKEQDKAELK